MDVNSPGAAALVCSWIILQQHQDVLPSPAIGETCKYTGLMQLDAFRWIVIGVTTVSALLMVSTVRFAHVGNTMFGRLGFRPLIIIMMLISVLVLFPPYFLVVVTTGYVFYGLLAAIPGMWRKWQAGRNPLDEPEDDEAEDAGTSTIAKNEDTGPRPGR